MVDGGLRLHRAATRVRVGAATVRLSSVGTGPPVLLCNGLATPIESWGSLVDSLGSFRFIAFDAPGVGDSPPRKGRLSIAGVADIAAAVLDHVEVPRAHVLGYSWGGAVAQHLAWRHPRRVDRLVLAATSVGLGAIPGLPWALVPLLMESFTTSDPGRPRTSPAGLVGQLCAIATWSSLPFLTEVDAPALVLAGTADLVVPVGNAHLLAGLLPRGEIALVSGVGHQLFSAGALGVVTDRLARFLDPGRVTPDR